MTTKTRTKTILDWAALAREVPEVAEEILSEIDPVRWIQRYKIRTEKLEDVEFQNHRPLIELYRDWHPNIVIIKGSQIGMTNTQVNKLLFYADNHNITAIYTMPTADEVFKFSQARFSPVIKTNEYLNRRMSGVDNAQLKRIGGSTLYFKGAQKASQAISVPADIVIHDEYDFSAQDILDTFEKRVGSSDLKWFWRFSTPTLPDFGIDALFKRSDQKHWLVKCVRCGKWQDIRWPRNLLFKSKRPYFGCYGCSERLRRRNGMWVAKYPSRSADSVYNEEGKLVRLAVGTRGYFVNPLTFTFRDARYTHQAAEKAVRENKNLVWKNFYNFDLGKPYVSGEALITRTTILKSMDADELDGFNVFGCDQGDTLHWVVRRVGQDSKSCVVAFGTTTNFDDVPKLFARYSCRVGIIDALPNKHNARDATQRLPRQLFMAYYKEQREERKRVIENKRAKDEEEKKKQKERETQTVHLDRTETLDASGEDWVKGRCYLVYDKVNMGLSEDVENFIRQMCSMKRDIEEDTHGNPKGVWKKIGDDHYRHADNYAAVASTMFGKGPIESLHSGGNISGVMVTTAESFSINDLIPQGMDINQLLEGI